MQVSRLHHDEVVHLNFDRLEAICDQLGGIKGETAICAAMEDIAVLLTQVRTAWQSGDLDALHRYIGQIATAAECIGLMALTRVAGDALYLNQSHDSTALAAVVARLARLGEGSLLAIWEAQDQSM